MLDPVLSLALTIQANPGIYALLLGSGISRSAGMPTGWEVVLDVLRKLAAAAGENAEPDPEAWFTNKYGHPPTYSGLLEEVAKSQAERSQLLRAYFEPTEAEREDGRKLPTKAHRSIAALVKMGAVRVIITTNFDRLIENALEAEGINPTVISSPDHVAGAMPLTHSRCTVVKIHGDYLDLRTRNTPIELENYDEQLDSLLDRVFDEFGLIIAGWSGEWDRALCSAIARAKGRRFSTYWTKHSDLCDTACRLAEQRGAQLIEIKGADEFFDQLAEKVRVLTDMKTPHPISVQAAIAQTKRYLPETRYPIRLHDLLIGEIDKLMEEMRKCVRADFARRVADFEGLSAVAASIIATGCFWGTAEHHPIWTKALNRLVNPDQTGIGLQAYPAVLLQYAAGIGAAAAGKLQTIYAILTQPRIGQEAAEEYLPTELFNQVKPEWFKELPGLENVGLPRSEHLYQALRAPLRFLISSEREYMQAFDMFEMLQSLEAAERVQWAMPGAFMYRYYRMRGGKPILRQDGSPLLALKEQIRKLGEKGPVLAAGFLHGAIPNWEKAVQAVDEMSAHLS